MSLPINEDTFILPGHECRKNAVDTIDTFFKRLLVFTVRVGNGVLDLAVQVGCEPQGM